MLLDVSGGIHNLPKLCRGGLGHRCRMGTPILIVYLDVRSVKYLPLSRAVGWKRRKVDTLGRSSCRAPNANGCTGHKSYPAMARSSSEFPCYLAPPSPSSRAEPGTPRGKWGGTSLGASWSLLSQNWKKKKKYHLIIHGTIDRVKTNYY